MVLCVCGGKCANVHVHVYGRQNRTKGIKLNIIGKVQRVCVGVCVNEGAGVPGSCCVYLLGRVQKGQLFWTGSLEIPKGPTSVLLFATSWLHG